MLHYLSEEKVGEEEAELNIYMELWISDLISLFLYAFSLLITLPLIFEFFFLHKNITFS